MADTRYLKRRHETWFFSLAVPRELRAKTGKDRIVASLKTRDLTVAQDLRWAKLVEAKEGFAKLSGRRPATAEQLDPEALAEIDEFARTVYREALVTMAADVSQGVRAWGKPELDALHEELANSYVAKSFGPVAQSLTAYCEHKALAPGSEIYVRAGEALLLARMSALSGRKAALESKTSDEPPTFLEYPPIDLVTLKPLRAGSSKRGGLIFAEVAARFIAERQRDPAFALTKQTKGQYEAAFRLFDRWAKQPRLDDVDRRKASDFLDAIVLLDPHWGRGPGTKKLTFAEITERFGGHTPGLSAKTINRYAMALSMVWQHAEDRDGYEGKNPFQGQMRPTAKRRGNSETDKRGFTPKEIETLLAGKPTAAPAKHTAATTLPWLALISTYSGMRLNEICSLDVEAVKETGDILFFDLTAAKTDAGVRCVPVHSQIIAAGFRDYLAHVKAGALWG